MAFAVDGAVFSSGPPSVGAASEPADAAGAREPQHHADLHPLTLERLRQVHDPTHPAKPDVKPYAKADAKPDIKPDVKPSTKPDVPPKADKPKPPPKAGKPDEKGQ